MLILNDTDWPEMMLPFARRATAWYLKAAGVCPEVKSTKEKVKSKKTTILRIAKAGEEVKSNKLTNLRKAAVGDESKRRVFIISVFLLF